MSISMEEQIKEKFLALGADVCGIGSIERFGDAPTGFSPLDLYTECKSVIAFGVAIPKGLLQVNPRLLYSHFNGDVVCVSVDRIAFDGAKFIESSYAKIAVPVPCDAPNDYWETDTLTAKGLISMKHTAMACGLGQLGKSTLLLNKEFGNRLVIGAVLTNLELISDPLCENVCIQGCTKCIDACPTMAIKDGSVNQTLCRPNTYGKTDRGYDTVNCNKCRTVCPMKNGK